MKFSLNFVLVLHALRSVFGCGASFLIEDLKIGNFKVQLHENEFLSEISKDAPDQTKFKT